MDWWLSYKEYAKRIRPPFLVENLKKVYKILDDTSLLAQQGLIHATNASDFDPDLPVPTWSELIAEGESLGPVSIHSHEIDTSIDLYTYKVTSSPHTGGATYPGFAELKVRNSHGKVMKWCTQETSFQIDGQSIYLTEDLELSSPRGMATLEFCIPSLNISFERSITKNKAFEGDGYHFHFGFLESKSIKGVRYYSGEHLLEATQGYTCPITGKSFKSFEELYDHHQLYHPSLQFGVHPKEEDAFAVDIRPELETLTIEQPNLEFRFFKPSKLTELEMEPLIIPDFTILPSRSYVD